jgi:hypothetical protein
VDLVQGFVDQSFKWCTVDWWAEVAGLLKSALPAFPWPEYHHEGPKRWRGHRGTILRRRLGTGSLELG